MNRSIRSIGRAACTVAVLGSAAACSPAGPEEQVRDYHYEVYSGVPELAYGPMVRVEGARLICGTMWAATAPDGPRHAQRYVAVFDRDDRGGWSGVEVYDEPSGQIPRGLSPEQKRDWEVRIAASKKASAFYRYAPSCPPEAWVNG